MTTPPTDDPGDALTDSAGESEAAGASSQPAQATPIRSTPIPIGIGVDLLERERLLASYRRFGERLLRRVFTERELAQAGGRVERLVGRFAAKEACAKALGVGMIGVAWREIEIERLPGGKPAIRLYGRAAARAATLGFTAFDVSISDTRDHAVAIVVALRMP